MLSEQIIIYAATFLLIAFILFLYQRKLKKMTRTTRMKVDLAQEEGLFEPVSLHPHIDLQICIGSAACVASCPEKDILGIDNGKAVVINASNCVGHGACFHACPVEAITLRIGTEKRGVELPHVNEQFETNIKGIYIAGELGGMGLIKNAVEQGEQAMNNIAKNNKANGLAPLDVVIIGAGPAGISASLAAKKHNLNSLTLEQDSLGGTIFTFPRDKIVMTSPMHLPLFGKLKLFDTSKRELLEIWMEVIQENGLIIKEKTKVEEIRPLNDGTFRVITANKEEYHCNNVLLATGRRGTPRKLNVPGENSEKVAYRLLEPERIEGKEILVVGGGDSAVESAMLLSEKNRVSLSYRKDKFSRIKPKNRQKISDYIQSGKIHALFNTNVIQIDPSRVILKSNEHERIELKNDLVYIFAGGELPTKFLQKAGVEIHKRFGYVMKQHRN